MEKNISASTIKNVLETSGNRLSDLMKQVQYFEELNHLFRSKLPDDFKDRCSLAHYKKGILTVLVKTPAWSTRLRYITTDLIEKLSQLERFKDIEKIECLIRPEN